MSRIRTLRTGSARIAALAAAIRAAADSQQVAVLRLQQRWNRHDQPTRYVVAYDAKFGKVPLDRDAINTIDHLMRTRRPDIAWVTDHDYHLDTGMLRRAPLPEEKGFVPEDDRSFGGADPVFMPVLTPDPGKAAA